MFVRDISLLLKCLYLILVHSSGLDCKARMKSDLILNFHSSKLNLESSSWEDLVLRKELDLISEGQAIPASQRGSQVSC